MAPVSSRGTPTVDSRAHRISDNKMLDLGNQAPPSNAAVTWYINKIKWHTKPDIDLGSVITTVAKWKPSQLRYSPETANDIACPVNGQCSAGRFGQGIKMTHYDAGCWCRSIPAKVSHLQASFHADQTLRDSFDSSSKGWSLSTWYGKKRENHQVIYCLYQLIHHLCKCNILRAYVCKPCMGFIILVNIIAQGCKHITGKFTFGY